MKKLSIILFTALVSLAACTKSKEVHPELGDGNNEIVTVSMKDVHVEYTLSDIAELQKVVFHYSLAEAQQFAAAEMTKLEDRFELTLTDLLSDTLYSYYYELFSMKGETSLTGKKTFHTQTMDTPEPPTPPTPPSDIPEGAINGLFTINANGDQVYFSQGNLQYQASTNTWRFAEHQWDYVGTQKIADYWGVVAIGGTIEGSDNSDLSSTYDGWIDLFGWGTSGYNHGANCYQPWSTSTNEYDYYPYGSAFSNLFDQTGKADWGYNPIINGGNRENQWRTMTELECVYVFDRRNTNSGYRYVQGTVNGIGGFILLPDNWNTTVYQLYDYNGGNYLSNIMDATSWNTLEQAGCVFFPASGTRLNDMVVDLKYCGRYWLSNCYDNYDACRLDLVNGLLNLEGGHEARFEGYSIRLITSKNK